MPPLILRQATEPEGEDRHTRRAGAGNQRRILGDLKYGAVAQLEKAKIAAHGTGVNENQIGVDQGRG